MLSNLYRALKLAYRAAFPGDISYKDYLKFLEDKGQDTMHVYPGQIVSIDVKGETYYVRLVQKDRSNKQTKS